MALLVFDGYKHVTFHYFATATMSTAMHSVSEIICQYLVYECLDLEENDID